jgi:hypothetical protein
MIDFQSSAIVESMNRLAHRSPSPRGEGRGEGELNYSSGRQPALIKVGEHGTRPYSRAVFSAIQAILSNLCLPRSTWGLCPLAPLRLCVRNPCPKKRTKLQNEPNFRCKPLPFRKKQRKNFQYYDKRNSSIARPSLFRSSRLRLFKPF